MDQRDAIGLDSPNARIKIVGVGGGGCNAVNRMIEKGIGGVEFVAVNTDAQALVRSRASVRIHIGEKTTRGLGAGGNPEVGQAAAEESAAALKFSLQGADMIFVTAGMGGGTGTGAAHVISRIARSLGSLTIGMVTLPFSFEGTRRAANARTGLNHLKERVDTLIAISNDRILEVVDKNAGLQNAFGAADDVLHQGIQAITELITVPGLVNLDFADLKAIMTNGGAALMAVGRGRGENRAREAAEMAISNRLLDTTVQGAQGVLLNVVGGQDMTLYEVNEAASLIRAIVHPDANVIFGSIIDPTLKDELRISLIATGFGKNAEAERQPAAAGSASGPQDQRRVQPAASPTRTVSQLLEGQRLASPAPRSTPQTVSLSAAPSHSAHQSVSASPAAELFAARTINTDTLDIPTFLRNRARQSG